MEGVEIYARADRGMYAGSGNGEEGDGVKFNTLEIPIYQHYVYDSRGVFLFLMFSNSNAVQDEYRYLEKTVQDIRTKFSLSVNNLPPEKRKEIFNNPLPEELSWTFGINCILPPLPYSNDGSRRRSNLKRLIMKKAPLFFDELYDKEIRNREAYFSGMGDCDLIKVSAIKKYINEYLNARMLADSHIICATCI